MNDHDDFMDVRSAYERYERAYTSWGRAVDGKPPEFIPLPIEECQRRAVRMATALSSLTSAINYTKKNLKSRGWRMVRKGRKQ